MATKLSSSNWEEAQPRVSNHRFVVRYSGQDLEVEPNEVYYIDNAGRVLVGWQGTISPPCDMDGLPLVNHSDNRPLYARPARPNYLTYPDPRNVSRPGFGSP